PARRRRWHRSGAAGKIAPAGSCLTAVCDPARGEPAAARVDVRLVPAALTGWAVTAAGIWWPVGRAVASCCVVLLGAAALACYGARRPGPGRWIFRAPLQRLRDDKMSGRVVVFARASDFGDLTVGQPVRFTARINRPGRRDLTV